MTTATSSIEVVSELDGYSATLNVGGHVIQFDTWWQGDDMDSIVAVGVHLDDATMAAATRAFVDGPLTTLYGDYHGGDSVYGALLPEADTAWATATIRRRRGLHGESPDDLTPYTEIRFSW